MILLIMGNKMCENVSALLSNTEQHRKNCTYLLTYSVKASVHTSAIKSRLGEKIYLWESLKVKVTKKKYSC